MNAKLAIITSVIVLASGWNNTFSVGFSGGNGSLNNPFLISNMVELTLLADSINNGNTYTGKHIALTSDVDLANANWKPMGTKENPFKGTFDGKNHAVTGFAIVTENDHVGFFGYVSKATIKNLTVKNGTVTGRSFVGGIVGGAESAKILGCKNGLAIQAIGIAGNTSSGYAGGISGAIYGVTKIDSCINTGSVKCKTLYAGGIVGACFTGQEKSNSDNSYIANCSNLAVIYSSQDNVGGIVGGISTGSYVPIYNCFNTQKISSSSGCVGGIVGIGNTAIIENCYNTGAISAKRKKTGGILGSGTFTLVSNCYNTGLVSVTETTEKDTREGISGIAESMDGKISNCYYLENTGTDLNGGKSKSAAEMKTKKFVDALNARQKPQAWELPASETINNGYPVLTKFDVTSKKK